MSIAFAVAASAQTVAPVDTLDYLPAAHPSARVVDRVSTKDYIREKLVLAGLNGQPIPSILCLPLSGAKPYPVVLLIHGAYIDTKENMITRLAAPLAARGIACIAFDLPGHGQRSGQDDGGFHQALGTSLMRGAAANSKSLIARALRAASTKPAVSDDDTMLATARGLAHSVTDARRVLDYVLTRPEIDPHHVAVDGVSLGGAIAVDAASVDPRISVIVVNVTGGIKTMDAQVRDKPNLKAAWEMIDPSAHAAAISPRPVLMLNGKRDPIVKPDNARDLYAHLGDPKEIRWFDTGHSIPQSGLDGQVTWIENQFGLKPATPR